MLSIRVIPALVVTSVLFFYTSNVLGGVKLDDVMSKEEQKKIGLSKLNEKQKKEFELWLNQKFVLRSSSIETSSDLYISENMDNGARLQLSDGSLYEISPDDTEISAGWLLPFPLKIEKTEDQLKA